MRVLIYLERKEGHITKNSLELITAGRYFGEVSAIVIGAKASTEAAGFGVPVIFVNQDVCGQDEIVAILESEMRSGEYDVLLLPASMEGKDIAPRVAARLQSCSVTDVIAIQEGRFLRPAFDGTILEQMVFEEGKKMVATIRSGSFPKPEKAPASVVEKTIEIDQRKIKTRFLNRVVEFTEHVDLEGAQIVVAGGRGCGDQKTFDLVKELARVLGAEVGASRPAIEAGWISRVHQIGQSGKSIAPRLYIACGISGAMQHSCGVRNAGYIVAINKDESAPVFDIADLGIVGRCEKILPLLIDAVKRKNESKAL